MVRMYGSPAREFTLQIFATDPQSGCDAMLASGEPVSRSPSPQESGNWSAWLGSFTAAGTSVLGELNQALRIFRTGFWFSPTFDVIHGDPPFTRLDLLSLPQSVCIYFDPAALRSRELTTLVGFTTSAFPGGLLAVRNLRESVGRLAATCFCRFAFARLALFRARITRWQAARNFLPHFYPPLQEKPSRKLTRR